MLFNQRQDPRLSRFIVDLTIEPLQLFQQHEQFSERAAIAGSSRVDRPAKPRDQHAFLVAGVSFARHKPPRSILMASEFIHDVNSRRKFLGVASGSMGAAVAAASLPAAASGLVTKRFAAKPSLTELDAKHFADHINGQFSLTLVSAPESRAKTERRVSLKSVVALPGTDVRPGRCFELRFETADTSAATLCSGLYQVVHTELGSGPVFLSVDAGGTSATALFNRLS